jgi:hypothetical protein
MVNTRLAHFTREANSRRQRLLKRRIHGPKLLLSLPFALMDCPSDMDSHIFPCKRRAPKYLGI